MNTLPMRPAEAVQIGNSCFSFVRRDGRVEYFSNLEPFDFHADDQREAKLLRIAKFAESGVRREDLIEALGVSRSTVQRAVNQLRRDGEASFFGAAPRARSERNRCRHGAGSGPSFDLGSERLGGCATAGDSGADAERQSPARRCRGWEAGPGGKG